MWRPLALKSKFVCRQWRASAANVKVSPSLEPSAAQLITPYATAPSSDLAKCLTGKLWFGSQLRTCCLSISTLIRASEVSSPSLTSLYHCCAHARSQIWASSHHIPVTDDPWRGLFVISHIDSRWLNDGCLVAIWMCPYCIMTHCTDLFFPPRNRAQCVSTNWTGSSSTQRSSPSPSSFILGSGLLSSATLETLSRFTYMHTDIHTHSQMSTTHPSTDLSPHPLCIVSLVPSTPYSPALSQDTVTAKSSVSHVEEDENGVCQRGGEIWKYGE